MASPSRVLSFPLTVAGAAGAVVAYAPGSGAARAGLTMPRCRIFKIEAHVSANTLGVDKALTSLLYVNGADATQSAIVLPAGSVAFTDVSVAMAGDGLDLNEGDQIDLHGSLASGSTSGSLVVQFSIFYGPRP